MPIDGVITGYNDASQASSGVDLVSLDGVRQKIGHWVFLGGESGVQVSKFLVCKSCQTFCAEQSLCIW